MPNPCALSNPPPPSSTPVNLPSPVSWLQVCSTAKLLWPSEQFQTRKSNSRNPPHCYAITAGQQRKPNGIIILSGSLAVPSKYPRAANAPSAVRPRYPLTSVRNVCVYLSASARARARVAYQCVAQMQMHSRVSPVRKSECL